MSKEKLRFKIQETVYGYEGVNTLPARQKDLFEFMAKMKLDNSLAVPTFRQNLPELTTTSDAEIQQLYAEAVDKRRKKDAARKAAKEGGVEETPQAPAPAPAPPAAPVDEQPQKLTISFQGKAFSYEGLPSKRQEALCDFLIKQKVEGESAYAAFRENFPEQKLSDAAIEEIIEERKRSRAERKKNKGTDKPATTETPAVVKTTPASPPPAVATPVVVPSSPTTPATANKAATELSQIPDAEKDSIYSFIRGVLDAPNVDIATTIRTTPGPAATATPAAITTPRTEGEEQLATSSRTEKLSIYCQEEGSTTSKMILATSKTSYAELTQLVEKKFGKPMSLAFYEGEDKIELDDDDTLELFFAQEKGGKLRLSISPAAEKRKVVDDKLTEAASSSTTAVAVANASAAGKPVAAAHPVKHTELRSYTGHTAAIYSVSWSPKGDKFVTASRDKSVRVWTVQDSQVKTMKGGHNGLVLSCDFSPTGDHVVSSSEDHNIKIWNVKDGSKVVSLKGHTDKVYSVQYNSSGAYIVSGSCDRTVRVWNADTGSAIVELKGHTLPIFSCCFSLTDAGRYVASGSDDRLIKIWDWREKRDIRSLVGHTGTVWSCKFSYNDALLVSTSMDHVINLWNVATGEVIRTMGGHQTPIHHAIFTRDDKYILSCARDWTIRVWETETGKEAAVISGHSNTVFHLDLRDNMLLSSSLDNSVKMWRLEF